MILSEEFDITFRGKPARLCVVRNDGYCWGEVTQKGEAFCIDSYRDQYDEADEEAALAFERAAKRNPAKYVGPSLLSPGKVRKKRRKKPRDPDACRGSLTHMPDERGRGPGE